jgi:PRTRC genetic system protein A
MVKLVIHNIFEGRDMPPISRTVLYEYWLAGNGLFLRAKRTGLEVVLPLVHYQVKGLADLPPYLKLDYPPVPKMLVSRMLELARQAKNEQGPPLEQLFHLSYDEPACQWRLEVPAQVQTSGSVQPVESGVGSSYERAILELHSHHGLSAYFSTTDDRDEARSFRLFAVIGRIFDQPEIRVRVGVFGHFWEVSATTVLEIPEGWLDYAANEREPTSYRESEQEYVEFN